jgi:hypothetical protein
MDHSRAGRVGTDAAILYCPDDASGDSGHAGAAIFYYTHDDTAGDAGSADAVDSCGTDGYSGNPDDGCAGTAGNGAIGAAAG